MSIGNYLRIFQRFWWVVLITTLIGAGIGYAMTFMFDAKYESTARLFVTTQSGTSVGDAYQNNLFSQERVVSYAGLATSEQVAARAVDQLKAPISAGELRSKITAAPVEKTVLLDITATDANPATAQSYANAVADQLVTLVSELETSRRGGTPAAGAVLVDEASYPSGATGPSLLTRIGIGAAGGFAVGLVLAVLAGLADTRLRRSDGVEGVTGSRLLGSLVANPGRDAGGIVDLAAGGAAAERLRKLRTNLQFAKTADGDRPRVIAVTSPTPGDGRTTTAIDLAETLAESGHSVVLVDGDFVNPSLAARLPLGEAQRAKSAERGLSTVLARRHELAQALIPDVGPNSWSLLPAGPETADGGRLWAEQSVADVLDDLRQDFDYVLIDTPPLTTCTDGALAASLGDGALVVARIKRTKTTALRDALESLAAADATFLGAVSNGENAPRGKQPTRPAQRDAQRDALPHAAPEAGPVNEPRAPRASQPPSATASATNRSAVTQTIPKVTNDPQGSDEAARQLGAHRLTDTKPEGR